MSVDVDWDRLRRYALRAAMNAPSTAVATAQDRAHDAIVTLLTRGLDESRSAGEVFSYATRVVDGAVIDSVRRETGRRGTSRHRGVESTVSIELPMLSAVGDEYATVGDTLVAPEPDEELDADDLVVLADALDALDPHHQTVLGLLYQHGLSARQVGELYDVTEFSVHGWRREALATLRADRSLRDAFLA